MTVPRDISRPGVRLLLAATLLGPALLACTPQRETTATKPGDVATAAPRPTPPVVQPHQPPVTLRARPPLSPARRALARLTLPQQVGQLLMVGIPAPGASAGVLDELGDRHVGSVFLRGRSSRGVRATAGVARAAQRTMGRRAATGVPLLVATDQEGGIVQTLSGPGFAAIPAAREQSRWPTRRLHTAAARWGRQLRAAGVNLNLAPVADVVPSRPDPRSNGPIGHYDRQLGSTARHVRPPASAFVRAMTRSGVGTAVKHFPGLGHVRGNTDTAPSVDDHEIGPRDPGLTVFPDVAGTGTAMVMTSTAVYRRIDPTRPASFSKPVVDGLLRGRLGYRGVVVSDDLGAARQVQRWTPGRRATLFVAAGGDLALTVLPSDAAPMADALVAAAARDPGMRQRVRQAALRVLVFKQRLGLLAR
jgi:beta-N-acetylhexosaminidase